MANKFYTAGEERAARVNDLFAAIARRYHLINDLQSFWLHRLWKRRLVALAHPVAGESALDGCCGTGDVAFALARQGAEVVGVDFSEAMLAMSGASFISLTCVGACRCSASCCAAMPRLTPIFSNH